MTPALLRARPSAANIYASSIDPANSLPPSTPSATTATHTGGFRAQINQLIPRHSYFRARVTIHQLDYVPFVSGQFAVRWKFKHVHSPPGARTGGLLGIVKTRSKNGSDKRRPQSQETTSLDATSTTTSDTSLPSVIVATNSSDSSSGASTTTATRHPSFPSSSSAGTISSIHTHSDSPPLPFSSSQNNASVSSTTLHIHPPNVPVYAPKTTSSPSLSSPLSPSFSSTTTDTTPHSTSTNTNNTPARGQTSFNRLKDHSVHWHQPLSTVIRLDVDRDNGHIFPCPFKLVIMQRPSDGDSICSTGTTTPPPVHRLGALYLNLSEYVGRGSVERRYLLRESKTNATLKLTIEMEFISGETNYVPPPLPKGEILNGLAAYLVDGVSGSAGQVTASNIAITTSSSSTAYTHTNTTTSVSLAPTHLLRSRPSHGLDLYGPYSNQEELELDLLGTKCRNPKPPSLRSKPSSRKLRPSTADGDPNRPGTGTGVERGDEDEDSDFDYVTIDSPNSHPHSPLNPNSPLHLQPHGSHAPGAAKGGGDETTPTQTPTFIDVERLPMAYGTKTTETLIEAIFNPVKISEERCESPFTVYVPPPAPSYHTSTPRPGHPPPPPPPTTTTTGTGAVGLGLSYPQGQERGVGDDESTPRLPPPHNTTHQHQIKRKPIPNIDVASVYSTETTSTSSGGSGGSGSNHSAHSSHSGHSRHSGMSGLSGSGLEKSVHSGESRSSAGVSASTSGGGGGGTKVKDWWNKTVGNMSRPGTPSGRIV